ncbi:DUF4157 domain-containing protein [Streptomyces rimosus]|uniref:eCIS core domain-containing protein n=1 Tax=Streptomyces rimosus TaxID=1927 RepID=UPI001F3912DB|nr:DUF4157 domain-containing protein [Streptomyces rimosus]
MRSHGHEHESGRGGGPGSSHVSQKPVGLNAHWLRHLQRIASGGATAEETEDHAQVQLAAVDKAIRSASHPLDAAFRQDMEARGIQRATLDAVQVHSGPEARDAAALVNAKAFTTEHHIVDGGNMTRDDWTHELGHVVDPRPPQGMDNGAGLSISDPRDSGEQYAEAFSDWARSAPTSAGPSAGPSVQRKVAGDGPHQHGPGCGHGREHAPVMAVQRAPAAHYAPEEEVNEHPGYTTMLTATLNGIDIGTFTSSTSPYSPGDHAEDQMFDKIEGEVDYYNHAQDASSSLSLGEPQRDGSVKHRLMINIGASPCSTARGTCFKADGGAGCSETLIDWAVNGYQGHKFAITINAERLYRPNGVADAKKKSLKAVKDMRKKGIVVHVPE